MKRRFSVFAPIVFLICAGCLSKTQSSAPTGATHDDNGRTDAPASGDAATSATNFDHDSTMHAQQGMFGGEPIASVPSELTSLAFDHDGVLWIGSMYSGVAAFKDGRFTLFDQYNTPLDDTEVSQVLVDAKNTKWFVVGRKGAVYTFDNSHWRQITTGPNGAKLLREDKRGRIWCIANRRLGYIEDGAIREFTPKLSANDSDFSQHEIVGYDIDRHGVLWVILSNASVLRIDGEKSACVFKDSPLYDPINGNFGSVECGPDNDEIYLWDRVPSMGIVQLKNGRLVPVNTGLANGYHPLRCFAGKKVALVNFGHCGAALGGIGGKFEEYADGTPLANETVTDVAIERPGRTWFACRFGGLQLLDGTEWTTFPAARRALRRMAWGRKPVEELIKEEAVDVDIQAALKNPRKFANKKIRFKGRIASSFEYAEMLDANGSPLGIWPSWEYGLSQFLAKARQDKPVKENGFSDGPTQSAPAEYGWPFQFTIVEEYPADATRQEKAKIQQEYLKSLAVTLWPLPIPDVNDTEQIRDVRKAASRRVESRALERIREPTRNRRRPALCILRR